MENKSTNGNLRLRHPIALDDSDNIVVPAVAEDSQSYQCPNEDCDEYLYPRGPSTDGRVRHFYHPASGHSCDGHSGESVKHQLCKSHAASMLIEWFEDLTAATSVGDCFEVEIDDRGIDRRADVCVTFSEPQFPYGNGIILEVQHKNKAKDLEATTSDYLSAGYSVLWTSTKKHYDDGGVRFTRDDVLQKAITVWPNAVPKISEQHRADHSDKMIGAETYLDELRSRIRIQWLWGERPSVKRRVTFPKEWYSNLTRDWFRDTQWDALFEESELGPHPTQSNGEIDLQLQIKLPPEWWADVEEKCRDAYDQGFAHHYLKNNLEDDIVRQASKETEPENVLVRNLGENLVPKSCEKCRGDADVYIYSPDVVSTYRCLNHISPETLLASV